jgi:hypothetical protein
MRRRTFDVLLSAGGFVITLTLVVAGILAFVGYSFANNNVTSQLSQQKITFPAKGSDSIKDPRIAPYLTKYAGQKLTTGAQAEVYADHFIAVHIADQGKGTSYAGKTYSELGGVQGGLRTQIAALSPTDPKAVALQKQLDDVSQVRDTVFKGETLRGLLLNAFAWWKVGQIGLWASIVSFVLAGVMALLTGLGVIHLRRTDPEREFLAPAVEIHKATA